MKQRMAPIQRRRAKPPNICLQNLTHSGVVLGGDKALGPSRLRSSAARASDKPLRKEKQMIERERERENKSKRTVLTSVS